MDRIFALAPFAEDQPHSKAILNTHVMHRGITTSSAIGVMIGLGLSFKKGITPTTVLRSSSTGLVVGMPIVALVLGGRMYGREHIEWQDRSWRLLSNPYQNQTDVWSAAGMVVGGAVGGARRGALLPAWRGVAGGAGLGSLAGVAAMMAWRVLRGDPELVKEAVQMEAKVLKS